MSLCTAYDTELPGGGRSRLILGETTASHMSDQRSKEYSFGLRRADKLLRLKGYRTSSSASHAFDTTDANSGRRLSREKGR